MLARFAFFSLGFLLHPPRPKKTELPSQKAAPAEKIPAEAPATVTERAS
jgi:hypothetical protein